MLRLMTVAVSAIVIFCGLTAHAGAAGNDGNAISKPYHMKVIGASLADQLATGLRWEFRDNKSFKITQEAKAATGLIRDDVFDWQGQLERIVKEEKMDIAVIALGGNDRQSFFLKGKRLQRFSDDWRKEYIKRLDRFMVTITDKVPVVYWVGLPIVSGKQVTKDFQLLNSFFRKVAARHGVTVLDIYDQFADEKGRYSSFGTSLAGKRRRLRQKDGIHFTMAGARKLGNIVGKMILDDLKARKVKALSVGAKLRGTSAQ